MKIFGRWVLVIITNNEEMARNLQEIKRGEAHIIITKDADLVRKFIDVGNGLAHVHANPKRNKKAAPSPTVVDGIEREL